MLEIIEGKLVVQNRKKVDLIQDLKKRGYHAIHKAGTVDAEDGDENDTQNSSGNNHGYDYLMSMPIWSLTMEKVNSKKLKLGSSLTFRKEDKRIRNKIPNRTNHTRSMEN